MRRVLCLVTFLISLAWAVGILITSIYFIKITEEDVYVQRDAARSFASADVPPPTETFPLG